VAAFDLISKNRKNIREGTKPAWDLAAISSLMWDYWKRFHPADHR
jgi:hypothetical protein